MQDSKTMIKFMNVLPPKLGRQYSNNVIPNGMLNIALMSLFPQIWGEMRRIPSFLIYIIFFYFKVGYNQK